MLTEQEIKHALHASRVAPMPVANPHGPIGWEQVAQTLKRILTDNESGTQKVVRSLEIPTDTWQKLEKLADQATRNAARPVTVSEIASAILQHYVT